MAENNHPCPSKAGKRNPKEVPRIYYYPPSLMRSSLLTLRSRKLKSRSKSLRSDLRVCPLILNTSNACSSACLKNSSYRSASFKRSPDPFWKLDFSNRSLRSGKPTIFCESVNIVAFLEAPLHSPRAHSSVLNSSSVDVTPSNVLNRMLSEKLSTSVPRSWIERYAPTPNPDFDDKLQSVKRYIFGQFTD